MGSNSLKQEIALELHDIKALQFGDFTFKSGIKSPMYVDLRLFVSYPKVLKKVARAYAELLAPLTYDRLAGIAYAALPIAGAVSLELERPWIYMRKEGLAKSYGLKKAIEGEYSKGERLVVIDDLITKGDSKLEVIGPFTRSGLLVQDFAVLIDYEKGGGALLREKGYDLHAYMTMREVVDIMREYKKLSGDKYRQCLEFLGKN